MLSVLEGPEVGCQIPWELGDRWVWATWCGLLEANLGPVCEAAFTQVAELSPQSLGGWPVLREGTERAHQCPAASYAILGAFGRETCCHFNWGLAAGSQSCPFRRQQVRCGPVCIKYIFIIDSFSVTSLSWNNHWTCIALYFLAGKLDLLNYVLCWPYLLSSCSSRCLPPLWTWHHSILEFRDLDLPVHGGPTSLSLHP